MFFSVSSIPVEPTSTGSRHVHQRFQRERIGEDDAIHVVAGGGLVREPERVRGLREIRRHVRVDPEPQTRPVEVPVVRVLLRRGRNVAHVGAGERLDRSEVGEAERPAVHREDRVRADQPAGPSKLGRVRGAEQVAARAVGTQERGQAVEDRASRRAAAGAASRAAPGPPHVRSRPGPGPSASEHPPASGAPAPSARRLARWRPSTPPNGRSGSLRRSERGHPARPGARRSPPAIPLAASAVFRPASATARTASGVFPTTGIAPGDRQPDRPRSVGPGTERLVRAVEFALGGCRVAVDEVGLASVERVAAFEQVPSNAERGDPRQDEHCEERHHQHRDDRPHQPSPAPAGRHGRASGDGFVGGLHVGRSRDPVRTGGCGPR